MDSGWRLLVIVLLASCTPPLHVHSREQTSATPTISLQVGDTRTVTLRTSQEYVFEVNTTIEWHWGRFSALVFQLHTQKHNITVRNGSDCMSLECQTTGAHVGMVQMWNLTNDRFLFYAAVTCEGNCSEDTVAVLAAVVGVPAGDPIPGGCSMTSYIEIDAQVHPTFTTYTTSITFQDSNQGFLPGRTPVPICDGGNKSVTKLEYRVYRKCLRVRDFSVSHLFSALEDMLTARDLKGLVQIPTTLSYSDIKKLTFVSTPGQAVVYNVLAYDTISGATSAYIPAASYTCKFDTKGRYNCTPGFLAADVILGLIVGLIGLFLCFFAHQFFHVEVFLFSFLIFLFIWFLVLSSATAWTHNVILGSSIALALLTAVLLFTFWCLTGWYYPLVILFGSMMGFLFVATILYTPVGSLASVFQVNYVYTLLLLCGSVVFMIPFVAFPALMNMLSSSVIGSFAVIYCISIFTYSSLTEILTKVVQNASISDFLTTQVDCPLQTLDIILLCVWFLLIILGMIVQAILWARAKRKFKRKERSKGQTVHGRYNSFPPSPYEQLKEYFGKRNAADVPGSTTQRENDREEAGEWEPLLSPNSSLTRQSLN